MLNILVLLLFVVSSHGYKILIFNPKFGISHVTFSGKIADTLAAAGHDVVVYQPVLNENISFTGSKDASIRYYTKPRNFSLLSDFSMAGVQGLLWQENSFSKFRNQQKLMYEIKFGFCQDTLNDKGNLDALRNEKFDLGITEIFESCGFGVFELIGIKKYIATHGGAYGSPHMSLLGIPAPYSYTPGSMGSMTDQMSFFERVKNFFIIAFEETFMLSFFTAAPEAAIREKIPNYSLVEAIKDSAFLYINSDENIDFTLPSTHKIVHIGGMGKVQSKKLDQKYIDIFNNASRGVILFSFGSVIRSADMPHEYKQAFLDAFAEFPDINFLWKYEEDDHEIAKGYNNVFTEKWLPQPDILDHSRLLAFISHGGMNSVTEASTKGVPMIACPIFADQGHNAMIIVRRKTGIVVEKSSFTKEGIVKAINEIISKEEYKNNAQLLSKMVKAKPMSADERIVKYAEFAAQFGDTDVLQTQGRYMNFIQLHSLDVIAFILLIAAVAILIIVWTTPRIYRLVRAIFRYLSTSKAKHD